MPNTSATGGYLVQGQDIPAEGRALRRFLHNLVAGVTGLTENLVRQTWDRNPAPIPSIGTDWVSFGIESQRPEAGDPYQRQLPDGGSLMIRHEEVDVACIFYGDNCQAFANCLRDGLHLSQNREVLYSAGFGLIGFSETVNVPELINDRYYQRSDIKMFLRREVKREYPILHFINANGGIKANRGTTTLHLNWRAT